MWSSSLFALFRAVERAFLVDSDWVASVGAYTFIITNLKFLPRMFSWNYSCSQVFLVSFQLHLRGHEYTYSIFLLFRRPLHIHWQPFNESSSNTKFPVDVIRVSCLARIYFFRSIAAFSISASLMSSCSDRTFIVHLCQCVRGRYRL